ncbi:MAG: hypothetical protein Q9M39_00600 [Sulfurovum sp.]|nr:hypothetical protein [Sulfurovum sp.]
MSQELIVRDYRYTKIEIEQMFIEEGFEVIFSKYVQARKWNIGNPLNNPTNPILSKASHS